MSRLFGDDYVSIMNLFVNNFLTPLIPHVFNELLSTVFIKNLKGISFWNNIICVTPHIAEVILFNSSGKVSTIEKNVGEKVMRSEGKPDSDLKLIFKLFFGYYLYKRDSFLKRLSTSPRNCYEEVNARKMFETKLVEFLSNWWFRSDLILFLKVNDFF